MHQREAAQGLSRWLEALVVLVGMISDVVTGILLGRQRLGRGAEMTEDKGGRWWNASKGPKVDQGEAREQHCGGVEGTVNFSEPMGGGQRVQRIEGALGTRLEEEKHV